MSIKFGDRNNIIALNYGRDRIAQVYYGSQLVYQNYFVKITFYFDDTSKATRVSGRLGTRSKAVGAEWKSTDDPHVWYVVTPLYTRGAGTNDPSLGIGKLFCGDSNDNGLLLSGTVGTCQVTSITGDYDRIETLDRLFQNCTAVTSISQSGFYDKFSSSTALSNVNAICKNCTGITDGSSLNGYNVLKNVPSISTHAATFTDADSTANLDQIPTSWGGNQAPPAIQLSCAKRNNAGWNINLSDPNCPDFSTVTYIYIFTTTSISKYDGVNMRKSNIWNKANGFSTSAATYYYPCFFQGTGTWPSSGTYTYTPTWIFCSDNYNGTLTASQSAGDMPGTLDHDTLGPVNCKYGTFDSTKTTIFGFLVLNNTAALATFNPSSTPFAIHSNTNFRDMTLNWNEL